jgi:hypothetical protein
MLDKNNEVFFEEYCKTCKYKNYSETDSPCAECIAEPVNLYSHKPVKWEGADGIFSGPPPRPDHAYQRAVKYIPEKRKDKEKAIARLNIDAEYTGNKVQSISEDVTDDQYPSATAVKKALEGQNEATARTLQTFGEQTAQSLSRKIDAPSGCKCGEFLAVEEVDEEGVVKKVKTAEVQTDPPDWNENDPTKPGYIENRTHYKYSERFIGIVTFTATSEKALAVADTEQSKAISSLITASYNLKIIIDGKVCTSITYNMHSIDFIDGQFNWVINGGAGYTANASIDNDDVTLILGQTYEVQFYNIGTYYKTIPEEYFPNTIFSQNNAPVKFGSDDDGNINYNSSVQGSYTKASGSNSHAEGYNTEASGGNSHAEGSYTKASGGNSHAEGYNTEAKAKYSHAEGYCTVASTYSQQVSGRYNVPEVQYRKEITTNSTRWISESATKFYRSNAWTFDAKTGLYSLVDPEECGFSDITTNMYYIINSNNSDVTMYYLTSLKSMSSIGKTYNCTFYGRVDQAYDYGTYAHIVGNGTNSERSNAHTLDWDGNAWFAGDVYVGSDSGTNKDDGSVRLATVDEVAKCCRILIGPTQGNDGTITYDTPFSASFIYYEVFRGIPVNAGNSVECCLMSIEDDGPLTVLNYTGISMDQNSDGNIVLAVRFSSYVSGKHISAEIKDTVSGFQTDDEELISTVVTVTESASLPTPTTAQVGQIVKVKAVDADGKITETEAVDMPAQKHLKWITVHSSDLTEEKTEIVISADSNGKTIASYNPIGLTLVLSTPADSTQTDNNGAPWIYPSATNTDNTIRTIGTIAGWKTIARDNVFTFIGGSSAMSCNGNVNAQLATYKIDGYSLDGVKAFLNGTSNHFPIGTHIEVSILCESD